MNTFLPWAAKQGIKPITILGANKSFLFSKTKKYVDMTSGLMVVNLGHNNNYIKKAFTKQLDTGLTYVPSTFGNYHRDKLSSRLLDITNKKGKVFYGLGGADVNENAMFMCLEYQSAKNYRKSKILTFEKSYHGGSSIISSLLGGDKRKINKEQYFDLPNLVHVPNPSMQDNGKHSINRINNYIKGGQVAGIMIEGSSGSAGCIQYPKGYLNKIQELCSQNDVTLILDEVMSGWGRTGKMFGYNHSDINPDIITTAKGLTCGYSPLGAMIVDDKISQIYNDHTLNSGLTYYGHPVSCAVANNCLDLYLENDMEVVKYAYCLGDEIHTLANEIVNKYSCIVEFRGNKLLGCFEFKKDETIQKANTLLLENGVFCYNRNKLLFIAPPINTEYKVIRDVFEIIDNVIEQVEE
jgi:taurine--2-oxoglutarate transaminase